MDEPCIPVQQQRKPGDVERIDLMENSSLSMHITGSLGQVNSCPSLQGSPQTTFVRDLLEGVLCCAASGSNPHHSNENHCSSESTGNPTIRLFTPSAKGKEDGKRTLVRNTLNMGQANSNSSSTSDTDSSDSDSENDTALLSTPIDEPEEAERDVVLLTKKEQDTKKVHIPRPDFVITEQHTLVRVGTISAVMDDAVVVTTFNLMEAPRQLSDADICNATALDTGSLLCFSDRTILGAVYETFGPVASPLYVVRFNNSDEIPSIARTGAEIMYIEQEMRLVRGRDVRGKGYDASGKDDEEADIEEFSDDEMERRAKKMKRSGASDRRTGSLKRARGHGERHGQGRHERAIRQKEGPSWDREHSRNHEVAMTSTTAPAARTEYTNLRGPNCYPFPPSHPQAVMRQPIFPSRVYSNSAHDATVPAFYGSGVAPNAPYTFAACPPGPGSALNPMQPTTNYGNQLPPPTFVGAAAPYVVSPAVPQQQQFVRPEQSWGAPENYHVIQQNDRSSLRHEQDYVMQAETRQVPHLRHPQLHHYPDQMYERVREDSLGGRQVNAAETNHGTRRNVRLQDRRAGQGFNNERYHHTSRR